MKILSRDKNDPTSQYTIICSEDELHDLRSGLSWMESETSEDFGVMIDQMTDAMRDEQ